MHAGLSRESFNAQFPLTTNDANRGSKLGEGRLRLRHGS